MSGSCLCGKIALTLSGEPDLGFVCHCADCQMHTGSAFSVLYAYPRSCARIDGPVEVYESSGGSGQPVERFFCGNFGSSLAAYAHGLPDVIFIASGALDKERRLKPVRKIFCEGALPWVDLGGAERSGGFLSDHSHG